MLFGSTPLAAQPDPYRAIQQLDARVLDIGYRMTVGSAAYCPDTEPSIGLALQDIAQYKDRDEARAAFGLSGDIAVLAVAPDSPALAAGLRPDDTLIAIGDQKLTSAPLPDVSEWRGDDNFARIAAVQALLEAALAAPAPSITIARTDGPHTLALAPVMACQSRFQVDPGSSYTASASGRVVTISSQLAEYARDDDELATVLAHELAHNLLRHKIRLDEADVGRGGLFSAFGKNGARIKATEIEADRLSVWLMANAGYDPAAAIRFWQRFGREHGHGIFSAPTHYRYKKRVGLFEEEIAKMQALSPAPPYAPPLLTEPFAPLR